MKNKTIITINIIGALIVAGFNLLFFLTPLNWEENKETLWSVYAFTMLVFFSVFIINIIFFNCKDIKTKFSLMHLIKTSYIWLLLQIAIAMVFIAVGQFVKIHFWISFTILLLLTLCFACMILVKALYSSKILNDDAKTIKNTSFINEIKKEIRDLTHKNEMNELTKPLERLYEKVCFVDPIANTECAEIENEILLNINKLEKEISLNHVEKANKLMLVISDLLDQRSCL